MGVIFKMLFGEDADDVDTQVSYEERDGSCSLIDFKDAFRVIQQDSE